MHGEPSHLNLNPNRSARFVSIASLGGSSLSCGTDNGGLRVLYVAIGAQLIAAVFAQSR